MITAGQIKEKLADEKDPVKYIDAEIDQCLGVWESQFDKIKDTISTYRNRPDESVPFDLKDVKDDFRQIGEMYGEISTYLKVRKAELKRLKQEENVKKAQLKRQEWLEKRSRKDQE